LDKSHGIKNISKKITNQEWKNKIKKTMLKCLKECKGDSELLGKSLLTWLNHWIGKHEDCDKEKCSGSIHLDLNKKNHVKIYDKIKKGFENFISNKDKYSNNLSNSLLESINRSFLVACPKTIDYR
jgi:hypothetical protein